jgi:hypothetical protein
MLKRAQACRNYTGLAADSKIHSWTRPRVAGTTEDKRVSRDNEPIRGQWYENVEEDETFRVLSVDEDSELIEIEYLDGDIEELDVEAWHEMDLELTDEPEGWSDTDEDEDTDEEEEEEEEEEDEDEDDEDDDDWDDDEDDDWDEEDDR